MALSKTMEDGIKEKDLEKIYSSFYTILLSDPGFYTEKFDEALEIVKGKNISGFIQQYNGTPFEDESNWTQEYWDRLASELMDNFCEERIVMLKKVSMKVYPHGKEISSSVTTNNTQKKTEPVQSKTYHQNSINGKLIAIIMIVVIILILIIVLVK